jgi:hypothetical protein
LAREAHNPVQLAQIVGHQGHIRRFNGGASARCAFKTSAIAAGALRRMGFVLQSKGTVIAGVTPCDLELV